MSVDKFIITNQQYNSGIQLDEYNDRYSLIAGTLSKDGDKVWQKWCYVQTKDKTPNEKAMPMKLELGSREQAIDHLKALIVMLGGEIDGPELLPGGPDDPSKAEDIP